MICAVNISEGRRRSVVAAIGAAGGPCLLDVHTDGDHNRSVLTLAGPGLEDAVRAVARRAVEMIDVTAHRGVHPRLGALDVVPFSPLDGHGAPVMAGGDLSDAIVARDRFARWAGEELGLPCFSYGPERSLPDVRRRAFAGLDPDAGPATAHPTAGACAVGARPALLAYNVWLATDNLDVARSIAAAIRGPAVRALGFATDGVTQVSCNLVDPMTVGPVQVYDDVRRRARQVGVSVLRGELVGLAPAGVVDATPPSRWSEIGLDRDRTVEARLERFGPG